VTSLLFVGGRCCRYGIFIKPLLLNKGRIIRHELVHVRQFERLGTREFLRQYLAEIELVGYFSSPLEAEARMKSKKP